MFQVGLRQSIMKGILSRYAVFLLTACSVTYTRNLLTASAKPSYTKYDPIVFSDSNEKSERSFGSKAAFANFSQPTDNPVVFIESKEYSKVIYSTINPTTEVISTYNHNTIAFTDLKTSSKRVLTTIKPKIGVVMIKDDSIMDSPVSKAPTKPSHTNNDHMTFTDSEYNSNLVRATITSTTEENFEDDKFFMDIPEQDCPNRGCRVSGECRECE